MKLNDCIFSCIISEGAECVQAAELTQTTEQVETGNAYLSSLNASDIGKDVNNAYSESDWPDLKVWFHK